MAGISLLLNLLKSAQGSSSSSSSSALLIHSHALFTASAAASAAAADIPISLPPNPSLLEPFLVMGISVAYCDAGAATAWNENFIPNLSSATENETSIAFECKKYPIEHRPLFSAFQLRPLALTSLRSFLQFYLPLIEIHPPVEDDDDFTLDVPEERHVDLLTPFHNSLKQIVRETSAVTIRRVLERLAVHYCSQRMAWKLLKDVSKSARRKAKRGMPAYLFWFNVSRTTFRGHALGIVASWIVQMIVAFYRYFIRKTYNVGENHKREEKIRLFWKEVYSSTIKFSSSLIFASIGAGIGALFHPSIGQWIGSSLGDLAGPFIIILVFEKLHLQI
ncbi:LOW QUALITY PROTEIN: uncharacterized protein LOC110031942 [Phalaenopsis equestris]|uniref:LOW QUALITY PROTEIN: uncharacterized protein LOC110031942 n=1 Tax=Phalaenopsis equestris TaxID=78828 RepID=UPI0009E1D89A|nr:LOW QUALITY PROTEIN: uncharacterized protein LOC110031942 [Phalaenopsis equestris]